MAHAQALLPDLMPNDAATPLMAQYLSVKARHPDCLLFFRLGDFYELFFEDALAASRALDLTLTRRGQHQGQNVPMCGVPAHAYENYLARLIKKGFRVGICEQVETPAEAKKRGNKSIVTRDVVRIVTPGTITEDSLLDARSATYLAALAGAGDELALAWLDLSNGKPAVQALTEAELPGALARIDAAEIIVSQKLIEKPELFEVFAPLRDRLCPQSVSRFDSDNARKRLQDIYHVSELAAFGDFGRAEIAALGALLDYASLTQKSDLAHLAPPRKEAGGQTLIIDPATRRNLELTRTMTGDRHGSLLSAIDRTLTGAGARMLAARLTAPLTDVVAINARLDAAEYLLTQAGLRNGIRESLRQAPELERALARIALGRGGPRDLAAVRDALRQAEILRSKLLAAPNMGIELHKWTVELGEQNALVDRLLRALAADLPLLARDGNFIARGYAAHLDEIITLRDDGRRLIANLQHKYIELSGVSALKIKHNNVIGYYIEVTATQADRLLTMKEHFIHRQTLANAARFTTVELGELERKINESADKALVVELQLFAELVGEVVARLADLRRTAEALAALDVTAALAELADEQHYARPVIDSSFAFAIKGGRHPVVEQALRLAKTGVNFIANDCDLAPAQRLWLLTGPNMAGKSTFLRQNALIALIAQMGGFVPAEGAHIGVIDRLFSRVGASDDLARGHSTFMVEMVETAAILNQAGPRALVILDEIGRGTATYDGLSIAWAVLENLHGVNQCRALFATHYHELTQLTDKLPALRCATMRIREWQNEVIFLHEVIEGTADRSYGIHVAQMAGLPPAVIARAQSVLKRLEETKGAGAQGLAQDMPAFDATPVKVLPAMPVELALALQTLKPDELSPRDAHALLYELRAIFEANVKASSRI